MAYDTIENLFSRRGIWRNRELVAEGFHPREIAEAVVARKIFRPVFRRQYGHVVGVFVSPELNTDPERALIVASFVTGGVIGLHSAGFKHSLTTHMPTTVDVHVRETYSRTPSQLNINTMRSRNPRMMTVGVDPIDTEFGVRIEMTNPARTVVDILQSGLVDGRDYEHGLEAITAFLSNGGEPGEIIGYADQLGLDRGERITRAVNAVGMGMGSRRM